MFKQCQKRTVANSGSADLDHSDVTLVYQGGAKFNTVAGLAFLETWIKAMVKMYLITRDRKQCSKNM